MPKGIRILAGGQLACFTRPEMKVERVSYDVITPSAARGLLEAIYWKPQFRWQIDKIHVLKPVRFTSIRRNEVASKATVSGVKDAMAGRPASLGIEIDSESMRKQRASLVLRDVLYGIEASIVIREHRFTKGGPKLSEHECAGKHLAQFERRARSGGHFQQPYFGTREFPADCDWVEANQPFPDTEFERDLPHELGWMLHDMDFSETSEKKGSFIESNRGRRVKAEPIFYRARIEDGGVINVRKCLAESNHMGDQA